MQDTAKNAKPQREPPWPAFDTIHISYDRDSDGCDHVVVELNGYEQEVRLVLRPRVIDRIAALCFRELLAPYNNDVSYELPWPDELASSQNGRNLF